MSFSSSKDKSYAERLVKLAESDESTGRESDANSQLIDVSRYYIFMINGDIDCLSIEEAQLKSGASAIQQQYLDENYQKWKLIPVEEGVYKIIAKHSDRCLTVYDQSLNNNIGIVQFDYLGWDTQQWGIVADEDEDDSYHIISKHSGKCADASSWSTNDILIQYTCDLNNPNQKWKLVPVDDEYYKIIRKYYSDYKCLGVNQGQQNNGVNIILVNYDGNNNQKWRITLVKNNFYKIEAKHSDKCLTIVDTSRDPLQPVIQADYEERSNQKWRLVSIDEEYFQIISEHSNLCLTSSGRLSRIVQDKWKGHDNQKWKLVPVTERRASFFS